MKILIIGGTGFIGEYVCREIVRSGVRALAVHGSPLQENPIDGVEYRQIDLDTDFTQFKDAARECEIIVFSIQPDIVRMKKMISALSGLRAINKIVYLSTLLVYPESSAKSAETQAPDPLTEYEKNKFREEELLADFTKENGNAFVIARLGNVYGDTKNRGAVNYLMSAVASDAAFTINGDGEQTRDYIFVEDAARLLQFLIFLKQEKPQEIFNVCSGSGSSILNLVQLVETIAHKKVNVIFGNPVKEKVCVIGDNAKFLQASGLRLAYDLSLGLRKTWKNYLKIKSADSI